MYYSKNKKKLSFTKTLEKYFTIEKIEFINSQSGLWETEHEDVINLMTKCWHEEPLERPTFSALKGIIRKINK